jgi:hypothetical protein
MEKVTPPNAAGVERETVNENDVVPESPSFCVTLAMERTGSGAHRWIAVAEFRAVGVPTKKSDKLLSVSAQPIP